MADASLAVAATISPRSIGVEMANPIIAPESAVAAESSSRTKSESSLTRLMRRLSTGGSRKSQISGPTNVTHVTHVGWTPNEGFSVRNLPDEWKAIFKAAGVRRRDLADPETARVIATLIAENMIEGRLASLPLIPGIGQAAAAIVNPRTASSSAGARGASQSPPNASATAPPAAPQSPTPTAEQLLTASRREAALAGTRWQADFEEADGLGRPAFGLVLASGGRGHTMVAAVEAGSLAEAYGVQPHDLILQVNEESVHGWGKDGALVLIESAGVPVRITFASAARGGLAQQPGPEPPGPASPEAPPSQPPSQPASQPASRPPAAPEAQPDAALAESSRERGSASGASGAPAHAGAAPLSWDVLTNDVLVPPASQPATLPPSRMLSGSSDAPTEDLDEALSHEATEPLAETTEPLERETSPLVVPPPPPATAAPPPPPPAVTAAPPPPPPPPAMTAAPPPPPPPPPAVSTASSADVTGRAGAMAAIASGNFALKSPSRASKPPPADITSPAASTFAAINSGNFKLRSVSSSPSPAKPPPDTGETASLTAQLAAMLASRRQGISSRDTGDDDDDDDDDWS